MKKLLFILLPFLFLCSWVVLPDQSEETVARTKVFYLYNFTKLIDWPSDSKQGNFVVGILGTNITLINELNKMATKKMVEAQKIEIKNISSSADAAQCQIVYILPENSAQLGEVVNKVKSSSTLIITEKQGLVKQGAGINFVVIENKLQYELNKQNIENHKLKVGSLLETMAVH